VEQTGDAVLVLWMMLAMHMQNADAQYKLQPEVRILYCPLLGVGPDRVQSADPDTVSTQAAASACRGLPYCS